LKMETIGLRKMAEVLKTCKTIMGYFQERPEYGSGGYQLIGLRDVPLRANGRQVGTRTESHTFTVGKLPDAPPDHYLHAGYGTANAIRMMLLSEIADRATDNRKHGCESAPKFRIRIAFWGSEGERRATFKVERGGDCNRDLSGDCYSLDIGDCHLTIAGFDVEPAGKWSNKPAWSTEPADLQDSPTEARRYYTVDPAADAADRDARKVA
jgi:hypothetical protein